MRIIAALAVAVASTGCAAEVTVFELSGEGNEAETYDPEASKLIFVSSERYGADLGGLEGADAKCQSLAEAAGHSGEFRAWLSTSSVPAWERLTHATVPYVLHTGTVVANDWVDFTSGTLRGVIDVTESDAPPPNAIGSCNPLVFWSGTDEQGAQYGGECDGWTDPSADGFAVLGVLSKDKPVWSTFCHGSCDSAAPLVCLEQ